MLDSTQGLLLPQGYAFHHLGYATTSMEKEVRVFQSLGYAPEGKPFEDPIQGVAGLFLTGPGPRIELLENLPGRDTLTPWTQAGVKIYHFAYEVDDMTEAVAWARERRAKVLVEPVPAIAFGGRRICFVMFSNRFMIEFIEGQREYPVGARHA